MRPLDGVLRDWQTGGGLGGSSKGKGKEEWIGWGVKGISVSYKLKAVLMVDSSGVLECSAIILAPLASYPIVHIHHSSDGMAAGRF